MAEETKMGATDGRGSQKNSEDVLVIVSDIAFVTTWVIVVSVLAGEIAGLFGLPNEIINLCCMTFSISAALGALLALLGIIAAVVRVVHTLSLKRKIFFGISSVVVELLVLICPDSSCILLVWLLMALVLALVCAWTVWLPSAHQALSDEGKRCVETVLAQFAIMALAITISTVI